MLLVAFEINSSSFDKSVYLILFTTDSFYHIYKLIGYG